MIVSRKKKIVALFPVAMVFGSAEHKQFYIIRRISSVIITDNNKNKPL